MNQWNRLFWAFFVFIGFVIIVGTFLNMAYLELLLGLVVIMLGIQKLGEEIHTSDIEDKQKKLNRNMDYMIHWSNATYDFIRNMKQRHEYRLYHLDKKRAEMEKKIEDNYRELARKLFDLENRINELAFAGVIAQRQEIRSGRGTSPKVNLSIIKEHPKPKREGGRLSELSDRKAKAIKIIRSRGKITTKEYTKIFKVSDRTAQNDLKDMVKKNLIKRIGDGAKTHYVMAF